MKLTLSQINNNNNNDWKVLLVNTIDMWSSLSLHISWLVAWCAATKSRSKRSWGGDRCQAAASSPRVCEERSNGEGLDGLPIPGGSAGTGSLWFCGRWAG